MNAKKLGLILFLLYLSVNLIIHRDYALSWDYHYHYYAGLFHLGRKVPSINEPSLIPFSSPDSRLTLEDPFGPFTQIIPALSQLIFADTLNLLPFDLAYNLPMAIFGSLGVLVLYFFLCEAFNFRVALISSIILALNPSYFAYLHNNMKDIPNAAAFAVSVWLFWRLVKFGNFRSLFTASLVFAFAFNVKINSIFIPVICGLYFLLISFKAMVTDFSGFISNKKNRMVLAYFFLAPLLALAVWWPFWSDPLGKLAELPKFYSLNTYNMPVLFFGRIYRSGINIPALYPYLYLVVTTPLPVLIPAAVGMIACFYFLVKKKKQFAAIIIWFFIPLIRYLSPTTGAIDGVRHFMEVLFPLSAMAGIGWWIILARINELIQGINLHPILILSLTPVLAVNLIKFHPYQASYFNSLIGGIKGASGKFDIDFWGTPQKEAVQWLNRNAPENSSVHIVMAQSTAATYLRPDLLENVNKKDIKSSDYTILLNRQSFFELYDVAHLISDKEREGKIAYRRSIDEVPLVWIVKK